MEDVAPANSTTEQQSSRRATILSLGRNIMINIALPILLYLSVKKYTSASEILALLISGVPAMIDALVGIVRRKRLDLLSCIVLASILLSLLLISMGGSPKVYLVRESFFTAAFGLTYLISLLFPRPLAFYFARYFATGNHPEHIAWFDSLWHYREFRHTMYVISVVWGIGFLFEAAMRTFLVIVLSTEQFVLISPFVLYGLVAILIVWMLLYSRQGRKKSKALLQKQNRLELS